MRLNKLKKLYQSKKSDNLKITNIDYPTANICSVDFCFKKADFKWEIATEKRKQKVIYISNFCEKHYWNIRIKERK